MDSATPVSDLPAVTSIIRGQLSAAIVDFEAANMGADPDEISRMIGKIAVLYPGGKLSEAEAEAQNQLYVELLSDIPQDVLGAAFRKCAQTLKFFPTVAEIRSAAAPEMAMRSWRLMRLKALALKYDREGPEKPIAVVTESERQSVKDELGLSAEASALLDRITRPAA